MMWVPGLRVFCFFFLCSLNERGKLLLEYANGYQSLKRFPGLNDIFAILVSKAHRFFVVAWPLKTEWHRRRECITSCVCISVLAPYFIGPNKA